MTATRNGPAPSVEGRIAQLEADVAELGAMAQELARIIRGPAAADPGRFERLMAEAKAAHGEEP